MGQIDVLVCGNSDPGTSGLLSPFTDMEGLYFDEKDEPDDFSFRLNKDLEKICDDKNIQFIKLDFDDKDDYYNTLVALQKFTNDSISISGTSREGHYEIVVDKDDSETEEETDYEEDESVTEE